MGDIVVSDLGKAYKSYRSQWQRLREWIYPSGPSRHDLHWVLRNVNFHLRSGESIGIVGSNGAGKSTLLKLLTGTTTPTVGNISLSGRVTAMLELGMGFHPDFTGRQNVVMGGQLQGFGMDELLRLMPAIEDFAEIGDYIDQPVRTYSSGMQMRLAFSVATAKRPDILIVDEALSVGDAYFQHKSFDRIRKFRQAGTTLLIVSHDRYAIQTICDRALLLERGQLIKDGAPVDVLDYYNAMMAERDHETVRQERLEGGQVRTISGSGEAAIIDTKLMRADGTPANTVEVGEPLHLEVKVCLKQSVDRLVLGFMIKDRLGQAVYGINTHRLAKEEVNLVPGEEILYRCRFPANLGKGSYSISLSLSREDSHLSANYEWRDNAMIFHVFNTNEEDFVGTNWLKAEVDVQRSDQHRNNTLI